MIEEHRFEDEPETVEQFVDFPDIVIRKASHDKLIAWPLGRTP